MTLLYFFFVLFLPLLLGGRYALLYSFSCSSSLLSRTIQFSHKIASPPRSKPPPPIPIKTCLNAFSFHHVVQQQHPPLLCSHHHDSSHYGKHYPSRRHGLSPSRHVCRVRTSSTKSSNDCYSQSCPPHFRLGRCLATTRWRRW